MDAVAEMRVGSAHFVFKGSEEWVDRKIDDVGGLAAGIKEVGRLALAEAEMSGQVPTPSTINEPSVPKQVSSLATYLKEKDAQKNQTLRFLATSGWLMHKGANRISTSEVARALKDNHQSRLGNPSDCLAKNISKGLCEKDGDGFFITPEGWAELGEANPAFA